MSDRDAFRAEQQARRDHGLRARHETREARAVRKQVAEEIALAIEALKAQLPDRGWTEAERGFGIGARKAAELAREIGSRDPA